MKKKSPVSTRGVSIVSILIGLAIGSIVMAGAIQLFGSTKRSFSFIESTVALEENGRFSIYLLTKIISMSGLQNPPDGGNTYIPAFLKTFNTSTPHVFGEVGGENGSDAITVRFQGDGLSTDCFGNVVQPITNPATAPYMNNFYIYQGNLRCFDRVSKNEVMIEGVEHMRFLYGVDTNRDGSVNYWTTADTITDWGSVIAARVALVIRTERLANDESQSTTFKLFGMDDYTYTSPNDRYYRKSFHATIPLFASLNNTERKISFANAILGLSSNVNNVTHPPRFCMDENYDTYCQTFSEANPFFTISYTNDRYLKKMTIYNENAPNAVHPLVVTLTDEDNNTTSKTFSHAATTYTWSDINVLAKEIKLMINQNPAVFDINNVEVFEVNVR